MLIYLLEMKSEQVSSNVSGRTLCGVMVNLLERGILVSEFELQSRFWTNIFGKAIDLLIFHQLWVKEYEYFSSRRMALALNNPLRSI